MYYNHAFQGILDKIRINPNEYIMAIDLNFALLVVAFLCLEKPTVINITAIILINGCSKAYNLNVLSFIATEKD